MTPLRHTVRDLSRTFPPVPRAFCERPRPEPFEVLPYEPPPKPTPGDRWHDAVGTDSTLRRQYRIKRRLAQLEARETRRREELLKQIELHERRRRPSAPRAMREIPEERRGRLIVMRSLLVTVCIALASATAQAINAW